MAPEPIRPVNGHKKVGCTGQWVKIGTYSDPLLQKCLACKATRRSRDEEDPPPPEPMLEEAADPEPELPIEARPMPPWVGYLLVALGTAVACWGISQAR